LVFQGNVDNRVKIYLHTYLNYIVSLPKKGLLLTIFGFTFYGELTGPLSRGILSRLIFDSRSAA